MDDYILEIDSSQRDPVSFPNPNEYTVFLNRPMYNVESIELITGKIPLSQHHMNDGNRQLQVDDTVVVFPKRNFSNGSDLATFLQTELGTTNVSTVTFDTDTNRLTFQAGSISAPAEFSFKFYSGSNGFSESSSVGTPFNLLGFNAEDTPFAQSVESGVVDLLGPTNLILSISTNDEMCKKDLYTLSDDYLSFSNTVVQSNVQMKNIYTARLATFKDNNYNMLDFKQGDIVSHRFNKLTNKYINNLTIRWYWNVGNKLIPYDFNNRNHFIKLRLKGSFDKLSVLPRVENTPDPEYEKQEEEDEQVVKPHSNMRMIITGILIVSLIVIIWLQRRRVGVTSVLPDPQSG